MCVSSNLFEKLLRVQRKREGGLSQICCGKLSVLIMCPSPREVRCSNTEKSSHYITKRNHSQKYNDIHNKISVILCSSDFW